jgi:glycosyltransferase involved in cell wall biosynthesis
MRIACLTGSWPSPSETFIAREVEALRASGAEVEVFSLWGPERRLSWAGVLGQLRHPFANCRWQFRLLGTVRREGRAALQAFWNLGAAFDLARRVEQHGLERVHAHFGNLPSTLGWVAAQVARVPFSFSVHARDVFVEPQFLAAKARAADHIVACNSAAAGRARRLIDPGDEPKISLIHHGLPLERFPFAARPDTEQPEVLAVGRFVPKKGFHHLVQAVRILRVRGVPITCHVVGDGPARQALESEAADLADAVTFPGWFLPDAVREACARATVVVVPSVVDPEGDMDGVPNVALEAAALGVPVVATDTGGLPDLVRHGDTGLVATAGDADALAACIEAVLDDPAAAAERARRARALVEAEFDAAQQAAKLATLLSQ